MFASGIFDHPLVVLAVIVAGAIIQWLTNRRQAEEARRQTETDEAGTPPPRAQETALDRKLRELLGEPDPSDNPSPPPPPVLRREGSVPTRDLSREEWQTAPQSQVPARPYSEPPTLGGRRSTPPTIALQSSGTRVAPTVPRERGRSLESLQQRLPSAMAGPNTRRGRTSPSHRSLWRDRKNARRAFVASLVFGPPKGLEP